MRREDGGLLTVAEWVHLTLSPSPQSGEGRPKPVGTFGPSQVVLPVKAKNPFRRESWNLTEQMRIQRRDPELAARLKSEA